MFSHRNRGYHREISKLRIGKTVISLNGDIITEIERIYNLTIETLNLEISRLKSKFAEKERHWWNQWTTRTPKGDNTIYVEELFCRIQMI